MNLHEGCSAMTPHASGSRRSPAHLSFACLLKGMEPVALDKPFTYFEFGFGHDTAISQHAASAPHGQFYAADCTDQAAMTAQAAETGSSNLTLLATSFAELAQGVAGLPQFDFIVVRCDYDRIETAGRQHIVDFIARHLAPGGIVYTGYNAMPGAATGHALQRLVLEYEACHSDEVDNPSFAARDAVQALADNGALYFDANPGVHALWDGLKAQPGARLSAMEPLYFADVAQDLAAAKLDFVSAAVATASLTAEQQDFLNKVDDPILRETLKDYICNTAYRSDVFVRGARAMHPVRHHQWLERSGLALTGTGHDAPQALARSMLDALAERPLTLAELAALPALWEMDIATMLETAALVVAAGQAVPFFAAARPAAAA